MVRTDEAQRLLRFLSRGRASCGPASREGRLLVESRDHGAIDIDAGLIAQMTGLGLIEKHSRGLDLSNKGATFLARAKDGPNGRDLALVVVDVDARPTIALANLSESPLAQLVRRKDRNGKPFLSAGEFDAGERLRNDYTRGQIMPRLGANWVASVSSGRRADGSGIADLTDAALGARRRVEDAIDAVGPELSGVLIDVCCFLKGLELVETERGWPVRSAKIVLKTALAALARHYDPQDIKRSKRALHWGAENYRPSIS
jgi:hypothetical protein